MKLNRVSTGVYVTEDGRYEVQKSWAEGECYDPHPVQISRDLREAARHGERPKYVSADAWFAATTGKKGYFCQGNETHPYVSWGVWDRQGDDYVPGGEHFDTKKAAVAFLEAL